MPHMNMCTPNWFLTESLIFSNPFLFLISYSDVMGLFMQNQRHACKAARKKAGRRPCNHAKILGLHVWTVAKRFSGEIATFSVFLCRKPGQATDDYVLMAWVAL